MLLLRFVFFSSLFYFVAFSSSAPSNSTTYGCEALVCLHGGICEVDKFTGDPICICPPKFTGESCGLFKDDDGFPRPYINYTIKEAVTTIPDADDVFDGGTVVSSTSRRGIWDHRRRMENEIKPHTWTSFMIPFAAMMILALIIIAMIVRSRRKKVITVTHISHPSCLYPSEFRMFFFLFFFHSSSNCSW